MPTAGCKPVFSQAAANSPSVTLEAADLTHSACSGAMAAIAGSVAPIDATMDVCEAIPDMITGNGSTVAILIACVAIALVVTLSNSGTSEGDYEEHT
jgi:hypothetical protein